MYDVGLVLTEKRRAANIRLEKSLIKRTYAGGGFLVGCMMKAGNVMALL